MMENMKILVINYGSTSVRFKLYTSDCGSLLASGCVEGINTPLCYYKYQNNIGIIKKESIIIREINEFFQKLYNDLLDKDIGFLSNEKDLNVISHRIVHGGDKYTQAAFINKEVLEDIDYYSTMAPMHNQYSLNGIKICQSIFPYSKNVAVFDTSFHLTIPIENQLYAIPKEFYSKYKIRKYGFHGISYNYVLDRYCAITNQIKDSVNIIICHLGGGSSICAIKNGKSYDTTMGFSPLSGMIMASRSGNIDPTIIMYLNKVQGLSLEEIFKILNTESGYYALCSCKDMVEIVNRSNNMNEDSILLRKMIDKDFKRNLFSMMSNFSKIDGLVLTGGIGSKNKEQREMLLSNLEMFGIMLDKSLNNDVFNREAIISKECSNIPIYVIPSNEEKEIFNQTLKLLKKRN